VDNLGKCLAVINYKPEFIKSIEVFEQKLIQKSTYEAVMKHLNDITFCDKIDCARILIPKGSCLLDQPFLEDNIDFFILYLKIGRTNGIKGFDCVKLIQHLNDCYRCFDIYSNTLQEYFIEKEQLTRKKSV